MPGWLLAAVVAVWAGAGFAQTITVRSGEHADFTRLVIALPGRVPYTLTRSEMRADLVFDRQDHAIDLSGVFDRVPKTRLTGIARLPGRDGLRLSLGCDCLVETFWFADASLVVDIRAQPDAPAAVPPAGPAASAQPDRLPLRPLPVPAPRSRLASGLVRRGLDRRLAEGEPPPAGGAGETSLETGLGESRHRLIHEIGRAASQGLLTPRLDRPPERSSPAAVEAPAPQALPEPRPPRPNIHLQVETSIDRDMRAASGSDRGSVAQPCLDPSRVDVSAWGTSAPFWQQIGPLRARLLGEFDIPDRHAVRRLARLYIHFGFGAEARQLLAELGGPDAADPVLDALASILDHGHAGHASALSGQTECAPMVALWSVLSYSEIPNDASFDGDALLRALSALPVHLRAHLGPILARRLHVAGYGRESTRVRRILSRSAATITPEARLVDAEIALADDDRAETAEAALGALVARNSGPSAEALLRLIDARLERGAPISYETAQLAGAYAVEYRGQPLGVALAEAYLSALAASGAFDQAFAELERAPGGDTAEWAAIRVRLSDLLTRNATDYDFLHRVLAGSAAPADGLDPVIANGMADRLLSLGFPGLAGDYVASRTTGAAARERKLLRARVALAANRPRQAEAELLGIDGTDVMRLRARARAMAGEHAVAQTLFDAAGDPAAARREAWLANDWKTLARTGDAAEAVIAELKLAGAASSEKAGDVGVLARNRAIVETSQGMRAAIADLLSAHPSPAQ